MIELLLLNINQSLLVIDLVWFGCYIVWHRLQTRFCSFSPGSRPLQPLKIWWFLFSVGAASRSRSTLLSPLSFLSHPPPSFSCSVSNLSVRSGQTALQSICLPCPSLHRFSTSPFSSSVSDCGQRFPAMLRAFFIPLCSLQNTLPPKVFFKFFKELILSFFGKFTEPWCEKYLDMQYFLMDIGGVFKFSINIEALLRKWLRGLEVFCELIHPKPHKMAKIDFELWAFLKICWK